MQVGAYALKHLIIPLAVGAITLSSHWNGEHTNCPSGCSGEEGRTTITDQGYKVKGM